MGKRYEFKETGLPGVYVIDAFSVVDNRGNICKEFDNRIFQANGIDFKPSEITIIQSNKGVLRGIHLQTKEPQSRLIRCITGKIYAVVVDLRNDSIACGNWIAIELNDEKEVYIPKGCALGTLALEDSLMLCVFDGMFKDEYSTGLRWDDPELNIKWPMAKKEIVVSTKDETLQNCSFLELREAKHNGV